MFGNDRVTKSKSSWGDCLAGRRRRCNRPAKRIETEEITPGADGPRAQGGSRGKVTSGFKATKGPQDWATQSKPNALADAAQDDESDDDDGDLRVARETDANVRAPSKSAISGVAFHASTDLLVTGGLDKTLRFFRIDGG